MNYSEMPLIDVVNIKTGKLNSNAAVENGDYPFFTCAPAPLRIDKFKYDQAAILLAGNNAEGNFHINYFDGKFEAYQRTYIIDSKDTDKYDLRYLFYALKECLHEFKLMSQGTSTKFLTMAILNGFKLKIPDINLQRKIAGVLLALDQKIATNEAINRNLLEQALAMVSEWEKIEQDNIEYKAVSSVADLNPDTYSPKEEWEFVNYLDTSSITEGTISELTYIVPTEEKLPSRARRKLKSDDIVYSTVRPNQKHYGFISQPVENMLASTGFVVVRAKETVVSSELLYLLITRDVVTEKMQQIAEGSTSTFPSIKPSDLGAYEIPVPKENSNTKLIDGLDYIFKCINSNQKENQRLAELRDSLLPKLMSGELDVSDLDI